MGPGGFSKGFFFFLSQFFPFLLQSGCDRKEWGNGGLDGGVTDWYMVHTPRTRNSMNLFEAESPRRVEIAADQADVSSVVVLKHTQRLAPVSDPSLCFIATASPRSQGGRGG